jgi:transcriptional regulator with XRE-family HTH domain
MTTKIAIPNFAERIRQTREAKGLTIAKAARKADVEPADWQAWEDGREEPYATQCSRIARALGLTLTEFFAP